MLDLSDREAYLKKGQFSVANTNTETQWCNIMRQLYAIRYPPMQNKLWIFMLQSLKTRHNDVNYIVTIWSSKSGNLVKPIWKVPYKKLKDEKIYISMSYAVISTSDGFFFTTSPYVSVKKLNLFCSVKFLNKKSGESRTLYVPSKGASREKNGIILVLL